MSEKSFLTTKQKLPKLWEQTDSNETQLKNLSKTQIIISSEQYFKKQNFITLIDNAPPTSGTLYSNQLTFLLQKFPAWAVTYGQIVAIIKPVGSYEVVARGSETQPIHVSIAHSISHVYQQINDDTYSLQLNIQANVGNFNTFNFVPSRTSVYLFIPNKNQFYEIQPNKI